MPVADAAVPEGKYVRISSDHSSIVFHNVPASVIFRNMVGVEEITQDVSTLENPQILEQLKEAT